MKTFFTADTHFNHSNIIKYCNRPFANKDEMNVEMIKRWNSKVGPYDHVWHVGDFSFSRDGDDGILDQLHGVKHLILGNHDNERTISTRNWNSVSHYHELKINGQMIVLFHYAMRVWDKSHFGSWQLYGHSHGSLPDDPKALSIDVGVDCHNFYPLEFEEIKPIMAKKDFTPIDRNDRKK